MNALVIILIILAIIVAMIFIMASLSSNTYAIVKEVTIHQPKQQVFEYIRNLKNAAHYNKWEMADPSVERRYEGSDGTVGFMEAWSGKKAGQGEQEIIKIEEGERIDYEVRFEKPFKAISNTYLAAQAIGKGQTRVIWGFEGERNLMMKVFHLLFNLPKALGKDLSTSLNNLKAILEK